jgi:hypothetical protein
MDTVTKIQLLKDEYLLLQKFYEDFDSRIVTIKGWSATIGIAALGAGFYQTHYLWLFATGAAIVFWLIEAVWKSFQYMYGPGIQELEQAFREDQFGKIAPLQIYTSWFEVLQREGFGLLSNLCLGIVAFPHAVTAIAGLILFLLSLKGYFPSPSKTP